MVWPTLGSRTAKEQEQEQVPATGELAPPRTACSRAGDGCGRGSPPPAEGVRENTPGKFSEIFDAKSRVWEQFGPENKLIEG